jgi:hypothetical protein
MMRARLRAALPATLLVHATTTLCALAASLPLAAAVPEGKVLESPAVGALFTAIKLLDIGAASPWRIGALPMCVALLLMPFLRVVWLRAQLIAAPLYEHARAGLPLYAPAVCVCAACGLYQVVLALGAWGFALLTRLSLTGTHDARLQDCAGLLLASPWLWALFVQAPTLADLAQLALVKGAARPLSALLAAWQQADRRMLAVRTAYAAAMAVVLGASLGLRLAIEADVSRTAWSFVWIGQVSALLQTGLRAGWCAWLVERVEQCALSVQHARASDPSLLELGALPARASEAAAPQASATPETAALDTPAERTSEEPVMVASQAPAAEEPADAALEAQTPADTRTTAPREAAATSASAAPASEQEPSSPEPETPKSPAASDD